MADIGCWPYERPYPMEAMMTAINAEPADPTARSVKPARIGNVMISLNQRPEMNDRSHPLTATPRAHRDSLLSPMAGAEVEGEPMKRARLMGYLRAAGGLALIVVPKLRTTARLLQAEDYSEGLVLRSRVR